MAEYLTLNGQVFDGEGIAPDVTKLLSGEQNELFLSGSLEEEEDAQILSAVTVLARQGAQVEKLPGGEASGGGEDASSSEGEKDEDKKQESGESGAEGKGASASASSEE